MLRSGCWREVRLINEDSRTVALGWSRPVALLWIDGDHSFEGVSRDLKAWLPHLRPDAKVVFDDSVDPTFGPTRLVEKIVADGGFERIRTVGKVTLLQRRAGAGPEYEVPEIAEPDAVARTVA